MDKPQGGDEPYRAKIKNYRPARSSGHPYCPLLSVAYPQCPEDLKYEAWTKIGEGTFGEVFRARDRTSKRIVAMKKILTDRGTEGFPVTALQEIKLLQKLRHENVVELIEVVSSKATETNHYRSQFYIVLEFCDHDLAGLLCDKRIIFKEGEIKDMMRQLLNGLFFIHCQKVLHSNLKTANILITKEGVLKLADFGLARVVNSKTSGPNCYTNHVVTLWYRPPELLLGDRDYGTAIDLWGAGCIMAEFWTRSPIMPGKSEQSQLTLITQLCGDINTDVWPGVDRLELFSQLDLGTGNKRKVRDSLQCFIKDQYALDLLDKLLTLDPSQRISSMEALNRDFFWMKPAAIPLTNIISRLGTSLFEYLATPHCQAQHQQQHKSGYAPRPATPPGV